MSSQLNPPARPLKILVTGFEAFDDDFNISEAVVNKLRITNPNVQVATRILSVEYKKAEVQLQEAVTQEAPDFIISLGEVNRGETSELRIETRAFGNSDVPDKHDDKPVKFRDEQETLRVINCTNAALNRFIKASYRKHRPDFSGAHVSQDGGSFLCNDVFFHALKFQENAGKQGHAIFLHLNDLGGIEKANRPISALVNSYAIMLRETINYLEDHSCDYAKDIVYSNLPLERAKPPLPEIPDAPELPERPLSVLDFVPASMPRILPCKDVSHGDAPPAPSPTPPPYAESFVKREFGK